MSLYKTRRGLIIHTNLEKKLRAAISMKRQLGNNRDGEHNHFDYLCTFVFHSANMDRAVRTTMQAIAEWESKTCLRFVKRTTEKEYLWFHRGNG